MTTSVEPVAQSSLPGEGGHALIRRIRWLTALGVSGAIFWYVGWWAAGPTDPLGPVTLLVVERGVVAMAELLALALVCAGIGTAICGARSAHQGPLAVAVGLAVLGLHGAAMDDLVSQRCAAAAVGELRASKIFPTGELIAETWLWLAVIGVGFVVGGWVDSWYPGEPPSPRRRVTVDSAGEVKQGVAAVLLCGLIAYNVIRVVIGPADQFILKGQVYFAVGVAFYVGALAAQSLFRTASRLWLLVAIALLAAAAYVIEGPSVQYLDPVGRAVVLAPLARPLPLEYAALGAIGGLLGYSSAESMRRSE